MAGSNRTLYLSALVACMTAGLFGYSVGFIGGLLVLPSFLRHFQLDVLAPSDLAAAQAQIVTVWLFGALVGVPLGIPVCSRLGRAKCLVFSAAMYVLGAALQLIDGGAGLAVFEAGRFLNGFGVGVGTLVSPMYISEISPPAERGMLMSGYQTVLQISGLVGFWGAYASHAVWPATSALQWRVPVAIQLLPGIILLVGAFVVPESPRYLASQGRSDDAAAALGSLRGLGEGDESLKIELEEVHQAAALSQRLSAGKESFVREAASPRVRKRLIVGVGLMIAQNMVGLNALNYYAPVIFMSAGFASVSASLFLTGVFGAVKLVSSVVFMLYLVRTKGNVFWLKLGSAICGVSMIVLAYFVRDMGPPSPGDDAKLTIGGIISVLMVYVFAFSFAVSLGPISWNVCSEIFPLHINAQCCAITVCTQWLFQIVIAAITPRLLASVGWITYLVYAGFCILTYVWVATCVPETRGVALGREMDEVFGDAPEDDLEGAEAGETTALLASEYRRSSVVSYTQI